MSCPGRATRWKYGQRPAAKQGLESAYPYAALPPADRTLQVGGFPQLIIGADPESDSGLFSN